MKKNEAAAKPFDDNDSGVFLLNTRPESPFESRPRAGQPGARAVIGGSDDYYGACSVETFHDVSGLSYTHEDAQGWLDYVTQFKSANFWRKDAGVQPWLYYEDYDNWQDTYGADAVLAFYHSGHGGMGANGVFSIPLGAPWGTLGARASSNNMRLGNEQVRYLFWSTCESLRVHGGHSPIRTWSGANLGFRMLFGYETVSWDSPDYGKFFWEEWNKGKSFSTAFLDASWRIAHDQAPSVCAVGATQAEAQDRCFNERLFSWGSVSRDWWWWRWYNAARSAAAVRERNRSLPNQLLVARLAPTQLSVQHVRDVVARLGVDVRLPRDLSGTGSGGFGMRDGDMSLGIASNGAFDVRLATPNRGNRSALDVRRAILAAEDALTRYGLSQNAELTFDRVRVAMEAGASELGSGTREGPFVSETTVQFKQVINGLPVVTPGVGEVRITLDNDGAITGVHSSLRELEALVDRPANTSNAPPEPGASDRDEPIARATASDVTGYERLLAKSWTERIAGWSVRGDLPLAHATVPNSTEVGYDIRANTGRLIAQRAVEADFGENYRKRYWVKVPLVE